jgi:hypothetical protein
MRAVKLAKVAAQAERLRVQALVRRQVRRAVIGVAGTIFAVGALGSAHLVAWLSLLPAVGPLWASVVLLVFDLLVALGLGAVAFYSKPGEIESEAQRLKQQALGQMKLDLAMSALVPALGLFIGTKRARGGMLLAGLASRLMRRRTA